MARVSRELDIDYHLNYQLDAWAGIPEYAESWREMDAIEREVFHLEWVGITESRLRELECWADQGLLSPVQYARFTELQRLVQRHRPTVTWMLAE